MSNTIKKHWKIYRDNTCTMSMLGRVTVLVLFFFSIFTQHLAQFFLFMVYIACDISQYFFAALMYKTVATLQENGKLLKNDRPTWVNYPATVFFVLKYIVLMLILFSLNYKGY